MWPGPFRKCSSTTGRWWSISTSSPMSMCIRWCRAARDCTRWNWGRWRRGMSKKEEILAEALALPEKQRADLADDLWLSLNGMTQEEIDQEWLKELKRRWAEFERGDVEALPM